MTLEMWGSFCPIGGHMSRRLLVGPTGYWSGWTTVSATLLDDTTTIKFLKIVTTFTINWTNFYLLHLKFSLRIKYLMLRNL